MERESDWTGEWIAGIAALAALGATIVERKQIVPFTWILLPALAAFGAAIIGLVTLIQRTDRPAPGWGRAYVFRAVAPVAVGAWMTWTALVGFHQATVVSWLCGAVGLVVLAHYCDAPTVPSAGAVVAAPADEPARDRRPEVVRTWEARMRKITGQKITVVGVEPWENPADGMRLFVELPAETGMTTAELATHCDKFAAASRLPLGCNVRILDADQQGIAVVDVMLRDCLTDEVVVDEPTAPASINDEFTVMSTPRGESLNIGLRSQSMVIGGTTGSGKTTLLHRIIMRLARCVDALIWVVDVNGGGVAEPWVNAWARGDADRPIVDWVADNEDEAAALVAVAAAVAKDRKTSREAVARKRGANSTVLPVDAKLPAIIVLTDEGGEVRQAVSILGKLAGDGITRLAQIGRAEGVRVIMSVLRGTGDLTDKGLRVNAALRICLRMEEESEYDHVLGCNPGRTRLMHTGTGYIRRGGVDSKPVFGRTVNVLLDAMDRHSIACAPLRPDLDERGQQVAARIRSRDLIGGREPDADLRKLQVMRDAAAGLLYANRWERYAGKLAEMRGDDLVEVVDVEPEPPASADAVEPSSGGGVLSAWAAQVLGPSAGAENAPAPAAKVVVNLDDQDAVDEEARRLLTGVAQSTARTRILEIVDEAGPNGIWAAEIERQSGVSRSRTHDLLKQMRTEGQIRYRDPNAPGLYVTPRHAETV